jgi:hypothetical protein
MRDGIKPGQLFGERFAWGRLFAYTRARELSIGRRVGLAVVAPLLPLLLFARHARVQSGKPRTFGTFLKVAPMVLLLLTAWSFGETAGYVTARP